MYRLKTVAILFLLLSGFVVTGLRAQSHIRFEYDSLNFQPPALSQFDDSILYGIWIINDGNQDFNGELGVRLRVGTSNTLLDSLTGFFLAVGDTFQLGNLQDSLSANRYSGGVNIVVIWPAAPANNTGPGDSAVTEVIIQPLAVEERHLNVYGVTIYPNPASGTVYLRRNRADVEVEQLRLFDLTGRLVGRWEGLPPFLPLEVPSGPYLLEVSFGDGNRQVIRLLHQ